MEEKVDYIAGAIRNAVAAARAEGRGSFRAASLHRALSKGFLEGVDHQLTVDCPGDIKREGSAE